MAKFEQALRRILSDFKEEFSLPGFDCAVWQHGIEIFRMTEGVADLESGAPLSKNTLYNLYSNTKVITCVAALQLFEQGLFLLEDELSRFFPEFSHMKVLAEDGSLRDAASPITIRDLFRMTAGFGSGGEYRDLGMRFYQGTGGACPASQLPGYLAQAPLLFDPGSRYQYGVCHEMLAALIEKLSGKSFGKYLSDHIFRPLGMEHTAFSIEDLPDGTLANQYTFQGRNQPLLVNGAANCLIPPVLKESASGGLISSVDDYMRFQQALASGGQLLSRRTIDLMRLNQLSGSQFNGYGYADIGLGYGLGVRTIVSQAALGAPVGFGPFGWGGASGSYGSIDPENNLCFFYMQHVFGTDDSRLHQRIRNVIYAAL